MHLLTYLPACTNWLISNTFRWPRSSLLNVHGGRYSLFGQINPQPTVQILNDENPTPPVKPKQATKSTEEANKPPPKNCHGAQLALRSIWSRLHHRLPNWIPSPHREDREYFRRQDIEDNLRSRVPPEERLRQIGLWAVEIFGPAEADKLHSSLTNLGWNEARLFGFNTDPGSWLGEQRKYGTGGSLNLGVIERPGKSRFLPRGRNAPLPDAVDYAHGWLYQLSPSVTAVILCFVMKESATVAYEAEINRDRKTTHEPLEGGYRSHNVEHLKRRSVELVRKQTRAMVADWFASHLPGLFSLADDGNRIPTAELLTTKDQQLFDDERSPVDLDWLQLATPLGSREVWTLKSSDAIRLCWPPFEEDLRFHGVIHLRIAGLTTEDLRHRGNHGDASYVSLVDDYLRGVLVHFAAIAALREITRRLRLTPSALAADTTSRRGTVRCLEQIRLFFDRSVGVPAFTSELAAESEHIHSYKWNCSEFHTTPWLKDETPRLMSETLRARTHFFAIRAQALEKETREHLEQLSAILSTRENIRTQARMELVTIGAAIVSIASLVVAVMSVDRFATYVNKQIERIYSSKH